ncbi:MAG: tetratricopeptide repeat protein [Candidatus Binataceae bacterium]|jgi:tetratricopeptide (TPR) repeat protein
MKIRFVSVIWGGEFVDMFLRVGLRSLLAEGNLPDLAAAHSSQYTIYTTEADAKAIAASPLFGRLASSVDVKLVTFSLAEIDAADFSSHNVLWARAIEQARALGEILFFLIPDVLYAEGTLRRWARRFEEGWLAVIVPAPQVVLETILPEIEKRFPTENSVVAIKQEQIDSLLIRHLHPMTCAALRETPRRDWFLDYDIRPIEAHGFVLRQLSQTPFAIHVKYFDRLVGTAPTDRVNSIVTEICSILSVEPLLKHVQWWYRPFRLDSARISNAGQWADYFMRASNLKDSEVAHGIALQRDSIWIQQEHRARLGGRMFRAQLLVARTIYRVIFGLQQLGAEKTAQLLAMALYSADFRRRVRARPRDILLVPTNDACIQWMKASHCSLLRIGQEAALLDLIHDHVLPPHTPVAEGQALQPTTARGVPFARLAQSAHIVSGPFFVEGFTVYFVDRVLWRDSAKLIARQADVAMDVQYTEPPGPLARMLVGIWAYPPGWPRNSKVGRAFYLMLHLPILEWTVRLVDERRWPFIAWYVARGKDRARSKARDAAKRLYHECERIPVLRNLAYLARRFVQAAQTEGLKVATRKAILRLPGGSRLLSARRLILRGVGEARANGLAAAYRRSRLWIRRRYLATSVPAQENHEGQIWVDGKLPDFSYEEICLLRALRATEDNVAYYVAAVLPPEVKSPVLELLRELPAIWGMKTQPIDVVAEQALVGLTDEHPSFTEYWLELGYLREDQGRTTEALDCYTRAAAGLSVAERGKELLNARAEALTARARILRQLQRDEDSESAYAQSLAIQPNQPMVSIERGSLLRRLGRHDEALQCFGAGIRHDEYRWFAPRGIRNARQPRLTSPRLIGDRAAQLQAATQPNEPAILDT